MNLTAAEVYNLERLKKELIETARHLADQDYHAALAGNLSARAADGLILCTRHGADKSALSLDDLIVCDFDGHKIEGVGQPTSEINMHVCSYRARPEVRAVIHAHPPTATSFAACSMQLDQLALPEMLVLLGPVALVPYATPGSEQLASQLAPFLSEHDAFLLENHGALTLGSSLREAALRMELIEHNARITLVVRQLGKPYVLTEDDRGQLMEIRRRIRSTGL